MPMQVWWIWNLYLQDKESQDEREMQTDEECPDFRTQAVKMLNSLTQNTEQHLKETIEQGDTSANKASDSISCNASGSMPYDVQNKVDSAESDDKSLVEASEVALPSDADSYSDRETVVNMEFVDNAGK